MGKVIVCTGRYAEAPYVIRIHGIKVYSIEELEYYVTEHLHEIDDTFFEPGLISWLKEELGLSDTAQRLTRILEKRHQVKDLITVLLCASDYYSEDEVAEVISLMEDFRGMESWQKVERLGEAAMKEGRYLRALHSFESLLSESGLSEQEYGVLLMKMGLAEVHIASYRQAAEHFHQAFLRMRQPEPLQYALYAYRLAGDKTAVSDLTALAANSAGAGLGVVAYADQHWNEVVEAVEGEISTVASEEGAQLLAEEEQDAFIREYRLAVS